MAIQSQPHAIAVHRFASPVTLAASAAGLLKSVLHAPGPRLAAVAVPGGTTPRAVFRAAAEAPEPAALTAYLAYTDERHVPAGAPESNYALTVPMIGALGIRREHVMRVRTELELDAAADLYDSDWRDFFKHGGTIPLAFVGLGEDGHTCSLFEQADLDRGAGRYAIAVRRPKPPHRVSVTPALLQRADRIVILVTGPDKAAVVHDLLRDPERVVAGRALSGCRRVELWFG